MIDIVKDWNGRDVKLRPGNFWHLTPKGGMFLNNARVGKGIVYSIAAIARQPGLSKAVSPYSLVQQGDPKEAIWEEVRTQSYGHLPSRIKSFYCFENKELADRAVSEWFPGRCVLLLSCGFQKRQWCIDVMRSCWKRCPTNGERTLIDIGGAT
jgi:hypothetical protein